MHENILTQENEDDDNNNFDVRSKFLEEERRNLCGFDY